MRRPAQSGQENENVRSSPAVSVAHPDAHPDPDAYSHAASARAARVRWLTMAWLAGFSALSVCGLLLAAYSRDEDARLLAAALVGLAVSAWPAWYGGVLYLLAPLDALIWCLAVTMWIARPVAWLRSFLSVGIARLSLHIAISVSAGISEIIFLHLLNAAFVAQVFLVSNTGGIRLGRSCTDRLRGGRHLLSLVRPAGARGA